MDVRRMKFRIIILFFIGIGIGMSGPETQAQSTGVGTVEGTVVRNDDTPAVGTTVVITTIVDQGYEGTKATDEAGYFSLSGVPSGGEVQVFVYNEKGKPIGAGFDMLNADEKTVITVKLVPSPAQ